jgi:hypothetical protein
MASRDDDKGAPTNDKDDGKHNDSSNRSWLQFLKFRYVYDFISHRFISPGCLNRDYALPTNPIPNLWDLPLSLSHKMTLFSRRQPSS